MTALQHVIIQPGAHEIDFAMGSGSIGGVTVTEFGVRHAQ